MDQRDVVLPERRSINSGQLHREKPVLMIGDKQVRGISLIQVLRDFGIDDFKLTLLDFREAVERMDFPKTREGKEAIEELLKMNIVDSKGGQEAFLSENTRIKFEGFLQNMNDGKN